VTGEWRKLNKEENNVLYTSPNWLENLRERSHLEDTGVDGMIILRWIFRKWDVELWTRSCWLG
jgi:hypothetical protein